MVGIICPLLSDAMVFLGWKFPSQFKNSKLRWVVIGLIGKIMPATKRLIKSDFSVCASESCVFDQRHRPFFGMMKRLWGHDGLKDVGTTTVGGFVMAPWFF